MQAFKRSPLGTALVTCVGVSLFVLACGPDLEPLPPPDLSNTNVLDGFLQTGLDHLQNGRHLQAVESCEQGLALDSTHAELNNLLANSEAAQGRYAPAIAAMERALRHHPEYTLGHLNLGGMHYKLGHFEEAEPYLLAAARLQPDHSSVHRRLAELYLATNRGPDAVLRMRRALELFPDDAALTFYLARAYETSQDVAAAITEYQRAVSLDIGFAEAHYRLSVLARRSGHASLADRAFRSFQHLQAIGAGDPDVPKQLKKLRASLLNAPEDPAHHYKLGMFFAAHDYHAEAINQLRRAADLRPGDTRLLNDTGRMLAQNQQLDGALEFYQRSLAADSLQVEALIASGNLLTMGGRTRESISVFERALKLAPESGLAQFFYGLALIQADQREDATTVLETALANEQDERLRKRLRGAIKAARSPAPRPAADK